MKKMMRLGLSMCTKALIVLVSMMMVADSFVLPSICRAVVVAPNKIANNERRRTHLNDTMTPLDSHSIPPNAYSALDLSPFLEHLKSYACTKKGEQSILALIPKTKSNGLRLRGDGRKSSIFGLNLSQRKRRYASHSRSDDVDDETLHHVFPVASSAEDARQEYGLVEEAMHIIKSKSNLPPIFKLLDGDTESDEDEWVELCMNNRLDAYQEIDLETILQAECLVKLLLDTYNLISTDNVKNVYSGLANVVEEMSVCIEHLLNLYNTLENAIEITRPKASLNDGNVYMFQLTRGGRFLELDSLRNREEELLLKIKSSPSADNDINNHRQLASIREEIIILEQQATNSLIAAMIAAAPHVERAQRTLVRLDIIFARAQFACEWGGVIPQVGDESKVNVKDFVHPVLALEKNLRGVVPVDLSLPSQVLMISGPNSGGKTLSLKSFGLTASFVKLGIPITVLRPSEDCEVRVDYFDEIFVQIGDSQDIIAGESTLMARLNACSALIQKSEATGGGKLVLLDELGGGTDPIAGAALSTAILEKLCCDKSCKIIATTHSPQLKALSLDDDRFHSASVLLESQQVNGITKSNDALDSTRMKPTFKLHYGFATESYPLGAASRCNPSLPDDVIRRAAELMSKGDDGDKTVEALRRHMKALEDERSSAKKLREEAQSMFEEVATYKRDMIGKLQSSEGNLARLEARLQNIYETLRDDETRDSYEVVGEGLSSLRLLRKEVKSEEALLSEKGLRRVADTHSFYDQESVVIIADGEWQWQNAVVKLDDKFDCSAGEDVITVIPSLDLAFGGEESSQTLLTISRRDVAVWDVPDADWGFQDEYAYTSSSFSSRKKSTTSSVLEKLKQVGVKEKTRTPSATTNSPSFTSARERKAAGKKSAKKKKGKKK